MGNHALLQQIFPHPGIERVSLMSPPLADGSFTTNATWAALQVWLISFSVIVFKVYS